MKEIRLWIILVATIPLFNCCNETESIDNEQTQLSFCTSVEARTRGADLTTSNLSSMGVFACYTKNGTFNSTSSTPNYMYNEKIYKDASDMWTYDNPMYWPADKNDKVSFFAYAPHNLSGLVLSDASKAGYPTLTYTVPTAEADQTDLLASIPVMNQNGGEVSFTLKHALTKVNISIESEMGIKVTALSIVGAPATGTLTFKADGFDWENYTGTQTFTATLADGGVEVTAGVADTPTSVADFFVLPNKASATLSLSYVQDGETATAAKNNIPLPATSWTQGRNMNYTLKVKKDGLSVTVTQNSEWADSGDEEVTSNNKSI